MTDREAMKMALEALEMKCPTFASIVRTGIDDKRDEAITALRQALEQQPADEPVAWATMLGSYSHVSWGKDRPDYPIRYEVPLYTQPPKRKPLTDEQREQIAKAWRGRNWTVGDIIDAIEAAHGITGEQA